MHALLALVLPGGEEDLQAVLKMEDNVPASGKNTPKSMSLAVLSPVEEEEEDLRPGDLTKQREEQKKKELYEEAKYLLDFYSKKTLIALTKCTRYVKMVLESLPFSIMYSIWKNNMLMSICYFDF